MKIGSRAAEINLEWLLPSQPPENATLRALAGKAVVIEFWATWCGPCVHAIPHLNEVANQFKGRPVQFLSITDDEPSVVEEFLKKNHIEGWVGIDRKGLMKEAYGIDGLPATVIIDANGNLAGIGLPNQIQPAVIEDLLAGKALSLQPPVLEVWIRPASSSNSAFRNSGNEIKVQAMDLINLLATAYELPGTRIEAQGLNDGLLYDALVSGPKGMHWQAVLRSALAAAFQISTRIESRETNVLILKAPLGKPPDLKEVGPGDKCTITQGSDNTAKLIGCPTAALASIIQGALRRPVIDETGITNRFDVELKWYQDAPESLINAVKRLGFSVEEGRRPLEYLIVEKL